MNQVLPSKTHRVDSKQDYGPKVRTNFTLKGSSYRVVNLIFYGQCVSHTPSVLEGTSAGRLCCCCILLPPVNKATTLLLVIYGLELRVFFVWLLTSCSVAFSCICSQPAQSSCYQLPYHSALSHIYIYI